MSYGAAYQKVRIVPNGTMGLIFNLDEDELGIYDTGHPASYESFPGSTRRHRHRTGRIAILDC
jgi:hypothetical protein